MSFAGDELDENQITAMDLPIEFKVNKIFNFNMRRCLYKSLIHEITIIISHHYDADHIFSSPFHHLRSLESEIHDRKYYRRTNDLSPGLTWFRLVYGGLSFEL